jgi:hypothetical protein
MEPWVGCDLDGTLAVYERGHFKEFGPYHIGEPVPKMVARIKSIILSGFKVKIMTARAGPAGPGNSEPDPYAIKAIENWCVTHLGQKLEVTCTKDYGMICLFDDRAIQIIPNTGERADGLICSQF